MNVPNNTSTVIQALTAIKKSVNNKYFYLSSFNIGNKRSLFLNKHPMATKPADINKSKKLIKRVE